MLSRTGHDQLEYCKYSLRNTFYYLFININQLDALIFSILCLTTAPSTKVTRKERNPWRQHVHRATRPRSYAIWHKKSYHVKSIICYLCFMQHAWSCYFFLNILISFLLGARHIHCIFGRNEIFLIYSQHNADYFIISSPLVHKV